MAAATQPLAMTIRVTIDLGYEFEVKANATEVFDLLSNVPWSASHFPKVHRLVELSPDTYRWEMEKIGLDQINVQTVYASRYVANRPKGTVTWTPVKGEGNALVAGRWTIRDKKTSTQIALNIDGELTLPLPGLMTMVVTPWVKAEFDKMVAHYIDSLIRAFGGEV